MVDPIDPLYHATMNALAATLDLALNGDVRPKPIAFCVLMAEVGKMDGGRVNYISNAERADMIKMITELLARLEGKYVEGGRA